MHVTERHWYWAPWNTTRWGFRWPLIERGGDEWHNDSWIISIPFLGSIVWFPAPSFNGRWGEEHVYAAGPEGYEGRIVEGCEGCDEVLECFAEWNPDQYRVLFSGDMETRLGGSKRESAPVQEGQDPLPESP